MEPHVLWHIHKSMPLVPIHTQIDPVHNIPSSFFKTEYNIFLPTTPVSSKWCHSFSIYCAICTEIPCCKYTQFLSLCSEENTLVCILCKMMLVHTVRHISGRFILILAFNVYLSFVLVTWNFESVLWDGKNVNTPCASYFAQKTVMCTFTGWQLWHQIGKIHTNCFLL